jgi:hypothetical protein
MSLSPTPKTKRDAAWPLARGATKRAEGFGEGVHGDSIYRVHLDWAPSMSKCRSGSTGKGEKG